VGARQSQRRRSDRITLKFQGLIRRSIAIPLAGALLFIVSFGCFRNAPFDGDQAIERLSALLPQAEPPVRVLAHQFTSAEKPELWVFASQQRPVLPKSVNESQRRSFPASALLSIAAAFGIEDESIAMLASDTGSAWEWESENQTNRLRTVETNGGFLSVLERFPKNIAGHEQPIRKEG